MIRGKYLTSMDDTSDIMRLRQSVFSDEQGFSCEAGRDAFDDMAVYAIVFDEENMPVGAGRLFIDDDAHFSIGRICVLKEARGRGYGDLIMRMLLYRAQELNAPAVYLSAQIPVVTFFERYGFKPYGEAILYEGVRRQPMRATIDEIDIEGSCKHMRG